MIERKILIGLITSTEYCEKIRGIWNSALIESSTAERLASWVWEYYEKYKVAPGRDIEGIYLDKLKTTKIPKELAAEIEQDILPGLSEEYENESFNVDFLLEQTEKYLTERQLAIHTENIQALIQDGRLEQARKMAMEYKDIGVSLLNLDSFILSCNQIKAKARPHPKTLMKPWLKEGQTTILYADAGVGKTLLALAIAYSLGLRNYDIQEADIGEWQVKMSVGCLYVDGELGELEMLDRIDKYSWLGRQRYEIKVLSIPEYQLETQDSFYLSERKNQLKVIEWLKKNSQYRLVVLDSASTLFGLVDENDNSEWNNKVNPFLKDLRALGVASLILHHAGKDGKRGLRGASAMSAMAQNIFRLVNHSDKDMDMGEAWFTVIKDKYRAAGKTFRDFSLHFTQSDDGKETYWEETENFGKKIV